MAANRLPQPATGDWCMAAAVFASAGMRQMATRQSWSLGCNLGLNGTVVIAPWVH